MDIKDKLCHYIANDENFDYAVLVTGDWGCGKTFYFKNTFKTLTPENATIIYVSVGGLNNEEEVMKAFGRSYLIEKSPIAKKGIEAIDIIFTEDIKSFIPQQISIFLPTIGKSSWKAVEYQIKRKIGEKEKLAFIVDDLERYRGNYVELLAMIQARYIDFGVHVIYVADEKKIPLEKKYWENKEKYIRHTYKFDQTMVETVKSILACRKQDSPTVETLHNDNIIQIFLDDKGKNHFQNNLRTLLISFDCFDEVMKLSNREITDFNQKLHLLKNIKELASYYKTLNINNREEEPTEKGFYKFLYPNEERNYYASVIFIKDDLIRKPESVIRNHEYFFLPEVIEILKYGLTTREKITNMLNEYYPETNEYMKSYYKLSDTYNMEENELQKVVTTITQGLKERKFPYKLLCDIANSMELLPMQYLPDFSNINFVDLIFTAIKDCNYPRRNEFFEQNNNYRIHFDNEERYGKIACKADKLMQDECKKYWEEKEIKNSKEILSKINNVQYYEISEDCWQKIFEIICKNSTESELKNLTCRGLRNLYIAIDEISKSPSILHKQVEYIEKSVSIFNKVLPYYNIHYKRKRQLEDLISQMNTTLQKKVSYS